jgi:hypothetical protein
MQMKFDLQKRKVLIEAYLQLKIITISNLLIIRTFLYKYYQPSTLRALQP